MSGAATPRRRAGALVAAAVVGLLGALVPAALVGAQDCPLLDPNCVTTTVEDTTTTEDTVEETTTTEDVVDDDTTTTRGRSREEPERPVETTSATVTITTLRDVLVPGDGTEGAESTTTTEPQLAAADSGLSDETLILIVVGGLTLVAVVIGLLTWRYWDATRPIVSDRSPARGR